MAGNIFGKENLGRVKILGDGKLSKAITITGLLTSKTAKQKIEKAGGTVK